MLDIGIPWFECGSGICFVVRKDFVGGSEFLSFPLVGKLFLPTIVYNYWCHISLELQYGLHVCVCLGLFLLSYHLVVCSARVAVMKNT